MNAALQRMRQKMENENYSPKTVITYISEFKNLMRYYKCTDPIRITSENIDQYIHHLVEKKYSWSKVNQAINAILFFYKRVIHSPRKIKHIKRPRKSKTLPKVLSQQEVKALINATSNLKHKAILLLIYSSGLRISEVINLKINDIHSHRMVITIRNAKGFKDRQTILSEYALEVLREYYLQYHPKKYLFNGQNSLQYSPKSIQTFIKKYAKEACIYRDIHPHILRHSFATHLIENGYDISYVQQLLGHSRITTTQVYTHVVATKSVKSPADSLFAA